MPGEILRLVRAGLAAALLALAPAARAETDPYALPRDLPVTLVADRVTYDTTTRRLVAEGAVRVFYGTRTLTADRIVYDAALDRISAEGRLVLRNPDGSTLHADYAELDPQLRDGLIRSARAMLDARFRLAAVEARRVGGRYNVLGRAVFSTCEVCPEHPEPLWQIRARRIVHDEATRLIHYENAVLDVAGVPVLWLPYFRHPDPTVRRSTGFLVPVYKTSQTFGHGLKLPFYWAIDARSDATLTPFVTTDEGVILEGEYRRRFAAGGFDLAGTVKYEEDRAFRPFRGSLAGQGHAWLGPETFGRFTLSVVSDDSYLTDFEYSNADRLVSDAALASYRRDGYWELGMAFFQSLRTDEPVGSIPLALPEFDLRETWDEGVLGGVLGLGLNGIGLKRTGGQDMVRATALLDWERSFVTGQGLLLRGTGELRADLFRTWDSTTVPNELRFRFTPTVGIEARFPLLRTDPGATHLVEPIAQIFWSEPTGDQALLPNEDSLLVEFDETNLFAMSRFAGHDVVEPGLRANLGLRYERTDASGWTLALAGGRIFRSEAEAVLAGAPGLDGAQSDWLAAVALRLPGALTLVNRILLDDDFTLDRNELRLDLALGPASVTGTYVYLSRDILGGALTEREEAAGEATLRLSDDWSLAGALTYDLDAGRFVRAGTTLTWHTDCAEVDFSVSRRFTSSDRVNASTSFGVQLRLAGLGTERLADRPGQCRLDRR